MPVHPVSLWCLSCSMDQMYDHTTGPPQLQVHCFSGHFSPSLSNLWTCSTTIFNVMIMPRPRSACCALYPNWSQGERIEGPPKDQGTEWKYPGPTSGTPRPSCVMSSRSDAFIMILSPPSHNLDIADGRSTWSEVATVNFIEVASARQVHTVQEATRGSVHQILLHRLGWLFYAIVPRREPNTKGRLKKYCNGTTDRPSPKLCLRSSRTLNEDPRQ